MLSISDWNMTTQCAQSQKQERANKLLSKCESWVGDSNLGWGSPRERRCAPPCQLFRCGSICGVFHTTCRGLGSA
jgi:hypothetical protein